MHAADSEQHAKGFENWLLDGPPPGPRFKPE